MTQSLLDNQDETTLMIRRSFAADLDTVFDALTNPAALRQWFGPGTVTPTTVSCDLRVGGQWAIEMVDPDCNEHNVSGEYLEIDPPNRVVFSWAWASTPDAVSRVTYALSRGERGQTVLTLTHERLGDGQIRDRHGIGWGGSLDNLAPWLAGRAVGS